MKFQVAFFVAIALAAADAAALVPAYAAPAYAAPAYAAPAYAATAVGSQTQQVLRSADGNSVVSTYSKAVDTPFSSVRKYDSRVSNDAIVPAYATAYHAPATYVAPATYAAPVHHAVAPAAYAAPVYHAPAAYAAPVVAKAAPYAVSYSPASTVAHLTFDGFGVHYGY